jgi:hypothetical protein
MTAFNTHSLINIFTGSGGVLSAPFAFPIATPACAF